MISKQRKIRFIFFGTIFLIVSPFILMYAFGNIFSGGNIFKTGGIYVITSEPDCEIFLDGQLKKTSNYFQRSFLIKNLGAKKYSVLVKKQGLNSWSKEVTVFESLVTEVKPFMVPLKVELREISKNIEIINSVGTTTKKNLEYENVLSLFTTTKIADRKVKTVATSTIKIEDGTEKNPIQYRNVGIWQDGTKIFASWLGKKDAVIDSFCINAVCATTTEVFNVNKKIDKIDFFLGDREAVLFLSSNCLSAVEIQKNDLKIEQKIYCGEKVDFVLDNNNYLYIKDDTSLFEALL